MTLREAESNRVSTHLSFLFLVAFYVFPNIAMDGYLMRWSTWGTHQHQKGAKPLLEGEDFGGWSFPVFVAFDVLLGLHVLASYNTANIARDGSFQWILYCWINASKSLILYFIMMQKVSRSEVWGPKLLTYTLVGFPLFYVVQMYRSFQDLYRNQAVSIDAMLHQDMGWHVTIDYVDIIYMFAFARPDDEWDPSLVGAEDVKHATRISSGTFIFLALLFHQQSFPGTPWHFTQNTKKSIRLDVMKSRKRSAIISIMFVDVPFLVIRIVHYVVHTRSGARAKIHTMMLKNLVCAVLQAVQLKTVQQVELSSSGLLQSLSKTTSLWVRALQDNPRVLTMKYPSKGHEDSTPEEVAIEADETYETAGANEEAPKTFVPQVLASEHARPSDAIEILEMSSDDEPDPTDSWSASHAVQSPTAAQKERSCCSRCLASCYHRCCARCCARCCSRCRKKEKRKRWFMPLNVLTCAILGGYLVSDHNYDEDRFAIFDQIHLKEAGILTGETKNTAILSTGHP